MVKSIMLVLVLCVAGCTVTLDNPLVKKESDEVKLLNKRIEYFELLEREAELVQSISEKKAATEGAKFEPVAGPQGPRGPRGLPGIADPNE